MPNWQCHCRHWIVQPQPPIAAQPLGHHPIPTGIHDPCATAFFGCHTTPTLGGSKWSKSKVATYFPHSPTIPTHHDSPYWEWPLGVGPLGPLLETHTTHVSTCNQFWPLRQTQHKHTHTAQHNKLAQHMCALLRVEQQFLEDLGFPHYFLDFWIKARRCPLFYIVQEIMLNLLSHIDVPQKTKNSAQQAVDF